MSIEIGGTGETPMSDINTTPLVDVMLVLLIIFLIAVPVAIQTIEKLRIPVFESVQSKDKVENLLLTVSTSDQSGRSAGDPGFEGASRTGECRVYFNNVTPVTSEELYDQAFE
ncbi:MAG: ExbD/TolR family protein, partial [Qipengyuania sp.]